MNVIAEIIINILCLLMCGFIGFIIGHSIATKEAINLMNAVNEYYRIKYSDESDEEQNNGIQDTR